MRDNVKHMEEAKKDQDSNENMSFQLNKKIYVLQVILNNKTHSQKIFNRLVKCFYFKCPLNFNGVSKYHF